MNNKQETWRPVSGFDGVYEVSSSGEVRNAVTGRVLRQWENHGYKYVSFNRGGKKTGHRVHRLVAVAFIPNPENKPTVNHLNGVKTDNNVSNLEWCTYQENERHSVDVLGKRSTRGFFTDEQIREIRNSGKRAAVLAREYGVSISIMQHILNRITYKHVA